MLSMGHLCGGDGHAGHFQWHAHDRHHAFDAALLDESGWSCGLLAFRGMFKRLQAMYHGVDLGNLAPRTPALRALAMATMTIFRAIRCAVGFGARLIALGAVSVGSVARCRSASGGETLCCCCRARCWLLMCLAADVPQLRVSWRAA